MWPLWVSYSSMTSRFPPFAFIELVSPYNKKNITRWLEDMNFVFEWQEQHLTRSLRSLVTYCSCHSNIKFISSRHRVISSIYVVSGLILWYHFDIMTSYVHTTIPELGAFWRRRNVYLQTNFPIYVLFFCCRLMEHNKIEKMPEKVFAKMANLATM